MQDKSRQSRWTQVSIAAVLETRLRQAQAELNAATEPMPPIENLAVRLTCK